MTRYLLMPVVAGYLGLAWLSPAVQAQQQADDLTPQAARMMDANKDGVISREEFLGTARDERLWTALDLNGDGVLDAEEQKFGIRVPFRISR